MTLQPHSPCRPVEGPMHTEMQKYTDTWHATQQQMNLTTSFLHDIPTFDGWDTMKLEDWLSDIEMAANILKESCACLAKARSCVLTHTPVCKALQVGKCWNSIRDILHLKLCNANRHTYTLHFMEIQQRENETLAAYVHHLKQKPRFVISTMTSLPYIFCEGPLGWT